MTVSLSHPLAALLREVTDAHAVTDTAPPCWRCSCGVTGIGASAASRHLVDAAALAEDEWEDPAAGFTEPVPPVEVCGEPPWCFHAYRFDILVTYALGSRDARVSITSGCEEDTNLDAFCDELDRACRFASHIRRDGYDPDPRPALPMRGVEFSEDIPRPHYLVEEDVVVVRDGGAWQVAWGQLDDMHPGHLQEAFRVARRIRQEVAAR